MATLGVHSEVGTLRTVLVCRPGMAHQRLTPGNRADLLFDDVLWVDEAQKDHYDFVLKMQARGVEVLELHDLLAETVSDKEARGWILDRRITANDVGPGLAPTLRAWLDGLPAPKLAEHLIGGIAILDLPKSEGVKMLSEAFDGTDFIVPPVPNTLFQREPSCWIYNGVTVNPMFWPGAPAGNAAAARRLQVSSALQGRGLHHLVVRVSRARVGDRAGRRRARSRADDSPLDDDRDPDRGATLCAGHDRRHGRRPARPARLVRGAVCRRGPADVGTVGRNRRCARGDAVVDRRAERLDADDGTGADGGRGRWSVPRGVRPALAARRAGGRPRDFGRPRDGAGARGVSGGSKFAAIYNMIVSLSTMAAVIPYVFCSLAPGLIPGRSGTKPTITPVEVIAFVFAMFTVYGCGPEPVLYGLVLLLLGLPVFVWQRRENVGSEDTRRITLPQAR